MRGRVGVGFQGPGFEFHRRRFLQFYFQRKRGTVGSNIFAIVITKAALASWQHSRLQIRRSEVRFPPGCTFTSFGFSSLLFAFRREVAHITWPRSFRAVEKYSDSQLFSLFGFLYFLEKKMLLRQSFLFLEKKFFCDKVLFNESYF